MPRGYALAERRRGYLPRSIYVALAATAQQIIEREAREVIQNPGRYLSPVTTLAEYREPKRHKTIPSGHPSSDEDQMSPPPFPISGGGSFGSVSYYTEKQASNARQLAKLEMDTGRFFNLDNSYAILTSDYGDQTYSTVTGALFRDELRQYFQQALDHAGLTDSEINTNAASVYVRDLWLHVDITNATNVPVFLEIYDCRPKVDMTGDQYPDVCVRSGLEDMTNQAAPDSYMCTDPFMSSLFTSKWNVRRSHKIILRPGEYHTHRVHWAPNRLIKRGVLYPVDDISALAPPTILEDLSYSTMFRFHGAPVVAKESGGSSDFATYSKTSLAVCWWSKVQFQMGFPYADDLYYIDNLITPVTGGAETVRPDGTVIAVETATI